MSKGEIETGLNEDNGEDADRVGSSNGGSNAADSGVQSITKLAS